MNAKQVGLTTGLFAAILHAAWALLVAIGIAKPLMNWVIRLHFIADQHAVDPFNIVTALLLVMLTFVAGYAFGWLFATLYNWTAKKVK